MVWTNGKNLQTVLTVTSIMIYECCTLQWGRRSLLERSNGVGWGVRLIIHLLIMHIYDLDEMKLSILNQFDIKRKSKTQDYYFLPIIELKNN